MPLTQAHRNLIDTAQDRQEAMIVRLAAMRALRDDQTVPKVTRESCADHLRRLS